MVLLRKVATFFLRRLRGHDRLVALKELDRSVYDLSRNSSVYIGKLKRKLLRVSNEVYQLRATNKTIENELAAAKQKTAKLEKELVMTNNNNGVGKKTTNRSSEVEIHPVYGKLLYQFGYKRVYANNAAVLLDDNAFPLWPTSLKLNAKTEFSVVSSMPVLSLAAPIPVFDCEEQNNRGVVIDNNRFHALKKLIGSNGWRQGTEVLIEVYDVDRNGNFIHNFGKRFSSGSDLQQQNLVDPKNCQTEDATESFSPDCQSGKPKVNDNDSFKTENVMKKLLSDPQSEKLEHIQGNYRHTKDVSNSLHGDSELKEPKIVYSGVRIADNVKNNLASDLGSKEAKNVVGNLHFADNNLKTLSSDSHSEEIKHDSSNDSITKNVTKLSDSHSEKLKHNGNNDSITKNVTKFSDSHLEKLAPNESDASITIDLAKSSVSLSEKLTPINSDRSSTKNVAKSSDSHSEKLTSDESDGSSARNMAKSFDSQLEDSKHVVGSHVSTDDPKSLSSDFLSEKPKSNKSMQVHAIIQSAAALAFSNYKPFVKKSSKPRPPNISIEALVENASTRAVAAKITEGASSKKDRIEAVRLWLLNTNQSLKNRDFKSYLNSPDRLIKSDDALKKAYDKCLEHGFFLGMENSWYMSPKTDAEVKAVASEDQQA